ncbi:hypothetical protein DENSPDRAFT_832127 [Dentipellis sp. KUC8613]|nr:hypothetical protein DENSPDRAFT_832127 [Dentipellis sp. KUC8613]
MSTRVSSMQRQSHDLAICQALRQATEARTRSDFWASYVRTTLLDVAGVTEISSQQAKQASRAFLDAEMVAMKCAIRTLSARRNATVSFVSRIPEHILLQIFAILIEIDSPRILDMEYERRRSLGWIYVTHVCRSWREVALGESGLWNRIEPEITYEWMLEILTRSSTRPLDVRLECGITDIDVMMEMLGVQFSRVSQLYLGIENMVNDRHWLSRLAQPAPLLESLSLSFWNSDNDTAPPQVIFAEAYPRLQSLVLINSFHLPCDNQVLRQLVHLEIIAQSGPDMSVTVQQLMPIVAASPLLESLTLENLRPDDDIYESLSVDVFLHHRRICLPHLRDLALHGSSCAVPLLLSQLDVPVSAIVSLGLQGLIPGTFSPTWDFLPQLLPWRRNLSLGQEAHAKPTFDCLTLDMRGSVILQMTAGEHLPGPRLSITIPYRSNHRRIPDHLNAFHAQGYFGCIYSLVVAPHTLEAPDGVERLLASPGMSGLTELHLLLPEFAESSENVTRILNALSLPAAQEDQGSLWTPALKHLVLERPPYVPETNPILTSVKDTLISFLATRQLQGRPIFRFTPVLYGANQELAERAEIFLGRSNSDDVTGNGSEGDSG